MEGKSKQILQEKPTSSASTFPKIPILAARPSSFIPSSLRLPPGASSSRTTPDASGYFLRSEPYFMNKAAAGPTTLGTGSSGTTPAAGGFFPRFEPFSMSEKENLDQNTLPPSSQDLTIGNSIETEVIPVKGRAGRKPDPNMESRKLKRIMSNRLSAQRSRIRKLQYLYDMEKKAESLQSLVHVLSAKVNLQKDKQFLMTIEKRQLQNRITALANRKLMVDGEFEARIAELNRLKELHMAQQNQQMEPQTMGVWEHGEQMMDPSLNHYLDSDQVDAEDQFMPEISMLDSLHLHQESPENNIMMPDDWEACEEQLTDAGLGQFGVEQLQNPYLNDQQPQENQIGSFNSSMGELEQIFNFNPQNGVNPSNDFI